VSTSCTADHIDAYCLHLPAVGVLMWEVFTCGDMPYAGQKNPDVVDQICKQRQHLNQPDNCPDAVFSIMRGCWQFV